MPPRPKQKTTAGFSIKDAIFILYSHKFKILSLTLLGLLAAGYLYSHQKPVFQSRSDLLVRYVVDRGSVDTFDEQGGVSARYSEFILGSELKILTSVDLAYDVAEELGVDVVLPHVQGERTLSHAASVIRKGIKVSTAKKSNIMTVIFNHPERESAQVILKEVIKNYFKRHLEIRRSTGSHELLTAQADIAASELRETEVQLAKLKNQEGILDLESSMEALELRKSTVEQNYLDTQADLAEQKARLAGLEEVVAKLTRETSVVPTQGPQADSQARVNFEALLEYQDLVRKLSKLQGQKDRQLDQFTETHSSVVGIQKRIDKAKRQRMELVTKYPSLVRAERRSVEASAGVQFARKESDLSDVDTQAATVAALVARLEALRSQKESLTERISALSGASSKIQEVERNKELQMTQLSRLRATLEKARMDETLDPSRMPNIATIQKPSQPAPVVDEDMKKIILGIAASGLLLGVGIAFLIEMVLDRRVKRAEEVEGRLQIPLMLSIPRLNKRDQKKKLPGPDGEGAIHEHFINPYATAIRDRLFYNFELENLHHRPKLIAVTSLSEGAGASTIAGGLAAALQGAGEARVLLIDMARDEVHDLNQRSPSLKSPKPVSPPVVDLARTQRISLKAALNEEVSPIQEKKETLYLSSGRLGENGSIERKLAPRKLFEMLPNFRRSEFDYIVFDMPPMGPISPTVAMAGIMDQVLLVLDAENTDRTELKKSFSELSKGKAKVSSVFNKTRNTAPRWLEG